MRTRLFVLATLVVAGCGSRGDDGGAGDDGMPDPTPAVLTVKLSQSDIHWKNGTADSPTVTVLLTAEDGTISEVTDRATFAVTPNEIGAVDPSELLVPTGAMAGAGFLSATVDNTQGSVDFKVFVEETVPGTAPAGTDALFDAATPETAQAVTIAYPPANAVVPPNLGEMEVHWTDPSAKNVYEVTLSGGFVTLKTYVNRLAGPGTWSVLPEAYWTKLSSGASGVDLDVRVRALATAAPSTYIEGSEKIRIAAEAVKGGLYYWNTTKQAIMRFDMTMPGMTAEQFYPQVGQVGGGCVGCHAVSKDGSIVAYRQEGDNLNYGNSLQVATLTKQLTPNTQQWNFAAIHPNNVDMFTTETTGLYRTDLTTKVKTPLFTSSRMSQPDVSSDGNHIVVSQVNAGNEVWTEASKLVVFDYDKVAKTVGAPRALVTPTGTEFPYYPSYSPNDEWVLYNQATGGTSYDNANAQLWVTKADGTGTPIHLTAAEVAGTSNSWPKFTPFVTHEPTATGGSETVIWFTTASRRGFGVRSTTASQKPQLWLAPFYPDRAAAGEPATAPAVRLPFQALGEGNHIAQWTQQIVDIQ